MCPRVISTQNKQDTGGFGGSGLPNRQEQHYQRLTATLERIKEAGVSLSVVL